MDDVIIAKEGPTATATSKSIGLIFKGESFYAYSLGLFYLRQLKLLENKNFYINEVGKINLVSLFYQSFLSIFLCYRVLGRRIYALLSIFIVLILFFINPINEITIIIPIIIITSGVIYFLITERGNYQLLPLALSILGISLVNLEDFYFIPLILISISAMLSVSVALLLALFFGFQFLINFDMYYFQSIVVVILSFLINALFNLIYIKRKSKIKIDLRDAILNIFNLIGVNNERKNIQVNQLTRSPTYIRGLVASLPLILLIPIFYITNNLIIFALFFVIMILNQTKILRFFDYHFLYSWIFLLACYLSSQTEITIINMISLFLFGTNPIFIYAMDNYNLKNSRGFLVDAVVTVTKKEINKINTKIDSLLNNKTTMVMKPIGSIKEYNDLWQKESLLLEWMQDALIKKRIKFFPDYYSLYYTEKGKELFNDLIANKNIPSSENYYYVVFKKEEEKDTEKKITKISDIFPPKIMEKHFLSLTGYNINLTKKGE